LKNEQNAQNTGPIYVKALTELSAFEQCVQMEEAIWGYDPADMIPRRVFLLASRIGGQVLGAFADDPHQPVGFAMALPAYRNGHAYLHSHMVGVLPEFRNRGVARELKLAQRDDALARGFELMEWTFDPLEIKNAHLNIAKLGAIVRRYKHDFYGPSSSPLQGGLPTDRVYAEWWLKSDGVERVLRGEAMQVTAVEEVEVPAQIYHWKASEADRARAREVQARNAASLEDAFRRGLAVVGYRRGAMGEGRFMLGQWNENFGY
jgi:predicted GNAT superfamily acetyltransferase